jgi:putative tryptophan/tyrosine transport system substrate-binding protein
MEGRDVHLEYRWPKGGPEGLPALAAQLVQSRFDMILAVSSGAARAAKRATSTVPIVFCAVGEDPVQNGMVSSVARPGGNATGTVTLAVELEAKRLELLNEAVLGLARAAVLWNPPSLSHRIAMPDVEAAARRLSIRFLIRGARDRHVRAPRVAGSRRAWSGSRLLRDRSRHEY